MLIKPNNKPKSPFFSSGPCAKRPGWSTDVLNGAVLGRSHRANIALKKIRETIKLTKEILRIPQNYEVGIVPASDTGAIEMIMWSMLGKRPLDVLAWESFGKDWVKDVVDQLKIKEAKIHIADYGYIVNLNDLNFNNDIVFTWNGTTSGVCVPNGNWISDNRKGLTICDATSAAFSMNLPWEKLDATTFSWQKVLGGEAQHGVIILSPKAIERLETYAPDRPIPKIFQLAHNKKVNRKIYSGSTINTPSMLCFEDVLDSLYWIKKIGGIEKTIEMSKKNLERVKEGLVNSSWLEFLSNSTENLSSTSICLKIKNSIIKSTSHEVLKDNLNKLLDFLEDEKVAYDINSYRDAPIGIRIWGGATVSERDIKILMDWLEWGFQKFIRENK